jgi:tRNA pseudouridine-54 N-methylase
MRTFVYFSQSARTSGNFDTRNLMDAGRLDIAMHVIINTFFLSHALRDDAVLHLVFYGMPDPPKHIEIHVTKDTSLSKKDTATLIKKILYKYKEGKKIEAIPGCFVEKKSFLHVIEELIKEKKKIFILDKGGKNIRESKLDKNSVFVIGDQNGLPAKELKRLRKISETISIGPKVYFASQVVSILNNEMDIRGI